MKNRLHEISERGTNQMFKKKSEGANVDGEWLRLICYDECDEFLFSLTENHLIGWNIGNSSPTITYLSNEAGLNKSYEQTKDIIDLSKYPLVNPTFVSNSTDAGRETLRISGVLNGQSGIGYDGILLEKEILISPDIDYQILFDVNMKNLGNYLTFKVNAFDKEGNGT